LNEKFDYYQLDPLEIFYLNGKEYGKTEIIRPEEYLNTPPDILSRSSIKILSEVNEKHSESFHYLPEAYADTAVRPHEPSFVYSVDRLGFNMMSKSMDSRWVDFRLPFETEMRDAESVSAAFDAAVEYAEEKILSSKYAPRR